MRPIVYGAVQEMLRTGVREIEEEIRHEVERLYEIALKSLSAVWTAVDALAKLLLETEELDREGVRGALGEFDIFMPVLAVQRAHGLLQTLAAGPSGPEGIGQHVQTRAGAALTAVTRVTSPPGELRSGESARVPFSIMVKGQLPDKTRSCGLPLRSRCRLFGGCRRPIVSSEHEAPNGAPFARPVSRTFAPHAVPWRHTHRRGGSRPPRAPATRAWGGWVSPSGLPALPRGTSLSCLKTSTPRDTSSGSSPPASRSEVCPWYRRFDLRWPCILFLSDGEIDPGAASRLARERTSWSSARRRPGAPSKCSKKRSSFSQAKNGGRPVLRRDDRHGDGNPAADVPPWPPRCEEPLPVVSFSRSAESGAPCHLPALRVTGFCFPRIPRAGAPRGMQPVMARSAARTAQGRTSRQRAAPRKAGSP